MFNIGNIFNIIDLALGALLILIGIICIIAGAATDHPEVTSAGGRCLGWGIYLLVAAILCFVFVGKAKKELADENNNHNGPFIVTIVFGAISSNVFYVLAGIFGLIAESQERNAQGGQQPRQEPQEEPKQVEDKNNQFGQ